MSSCYPHVVIVSVLKNIKIRFPESEKKERVGELCLLWTAERVARTERAAWTREAAARGRERATKRFMVIYECV